MDFKLPEVPLAGNFATKPPATPSIDYSGRLLKSDPASEDLKAGQLVFGRLDRPCQLGVLAQQTIAPSDGCVPIPEGVDPDQAATIGTAGLTAYQCIVPYLPSPSGSRIFINGGSGGVGTFAIQIAKALGCYVSTSCSTPNVSLCESLGADEVLDYKSCNIAKSLAEKHKDDPFDLVVDAVGSPENLFKAADVFLKPQGKFIQPGAHISLAGIRSVTSRALQPSILGGGKRSWCFISVKNSRADFEKIAEMIQQGKVKAVVEEKFAFEDLVRAFERLKTSRTKGKLLVKVGDA